MVSFPTRGLPKRNELKTQPARRRQAVWAPVPRARSTAIKSGAWTVPKSYSCRRYRYRRLKVIAAPIPPVPGFP